MDRAYANTERHPLSPFLPEGAKILMLGSFPPKKERWSMDFFYPNWINDMWRIVGLIFFDDKSYFEIAGTKQFDRDKIADFCASAGIALYDTATEICRLKDNASDAFLEIVEPTDIAALVASLPQCSAVVATGQKAAETIAEMFGVQVAAVGGNVEILIGDKTIRFWRMPSTSRAYPLAIEKKADSYRRMYSCEGLL